MERKIVKVVQNYNPSSSEECKDLNNSSISNLNSENNSHVVKTSIIKDGNDSGSNNNANSNSNNVSCHSNTNSNTVVKNNNSIVKHKKHDDKGQNFNSASSVRNFEDSDLQESNQFDGNSNSGSVVVDNRKDSGNFIHGRYKDKDNINFDNNYLFNSTKKKLQSDDIDYKYPQENYQKY